MQRETTERKKSPRKIYIFISEGRKEQNEQGSIEMKNEFFSLFQAIFNKKRILFFSPRFIYINSSKRKRERASEREREKYKLKRAVRIICVCVCIYISHRRDGKGMATLRV